LTPIAILKSVAFVAASVPAAALAYRFYIQDLTANPGDYITDQTGTWALTLLVISLTITPLRRLTKWNELIKLRRMLGLFAFFYATLHMLTWVVFVHFFEWPFMVEDVVKRPFITIGMATFLILSVLALTSNRLSMRKLGRRWQRLHRLVYVAAVGAVIHFWWLVKADTTEPVRWAAAVGLLLGFRAWWAWRPKLNATSPRLGRSA
jgi:sulfoxide reductase heme-binding subunit YedZ